MPVLPHFINGALVASASKQFADVHNPATGELLARTPFATDDELAAAVSAASAAPRNATSQARSSWSSSATLLRPMDEGEETAEEDQAAATGTTEREVSALQPRSVSRLSSLTRVRALRSTSPR